MAVKNLETLVLRGVSVACDVVTGLKRIGSKAANCEMPAMDLSHSRHPSQRDQAVQDIRPWYYPAKPSGVGSATVRAGRPESRSGVLASRSLAIAARPTVLFGWSLAKGEACPTAAVFTRRLTTSRTATLDEQLPERSLPHPTQALPAGGQRDLPALTRGQKRRVGNTTWFRSFAGTPSASWRGKKVGAL
jgi:hypothetical protein